MSIDPMRKFRRWMADAVRAGVQLPDAIALATADAHGRPSVRFVLLKDAGERGFVFYTNTSSAKGRDLAANPHAALAVYWDALGKQVRAEGRVVPVSVVEADAYWAERPWESRVASAASAQSRPIESREKLLSEYRRIAREYRGRDVPRPKHWTGYRIVPRTIEFWTRAEPRLHRRELFTRSGGEWKRSILQP